MNNSLKTLEKAIKDKKTITINYGKGYFTDDDIKELSYWDNEIKTYKSETGIWDLKLLYDIAKGEIENTKIEIGE